MCCASEGLCQAELRLSHVVSFNLRYLSTIGNDIFIFVFSHYTTMILCQREQSISLYANPKVSQHIC